ncbi:MAG: hypothetical protein GX971_06305 [Firmicutes bacterium]|nr:hypothetical protein [Bacillota bacterium]
MKLRKLALVLALVLMASTLTPVFASPFADVPADHWAYDSIAELAAAGLIEGYPDGTYGGSRMMTRYEAAMVFARALNRLETQIANIDLLPELDRVKAELMAEIEAALAAAPVETTVVERVIVDKDMDEEALARLRANEIAAEALGNDMASLEERMLSLIDGIRFDLNKLEDQVAGVEQPSLDEIEALIAARVQEGLVEAAAGVKETTIVERVVATTPELSKEDVEFIAEALIRRQVQKYDTLIQENRDLITGLVEWVDELDTDVAVLKDDVAELKTSVAALEKAPKLAGSLTLKGEYKYPNAGDPEKDYVFTQKGNLDLNIKASDATNIRAFLGYEIPAGELKPEKLTAFGAEVTSTTPLSRLLVGKLDHTKPRYDFDKHSFSKYVLKPAAYDFGGLARVDIMDDLKLDLFVGQKEIGSKLAKGAIALSYEFIPELGIRLTGALDKPVEKMFKNYAAGIGLFGTVAGVEYTGDFAMDFAAKDKNFLAAATAKTEFGPVTVDGSFVFQEDNYKINRQGVVTDKLNKFIVEGGLAAEELEFVGAEFDLSGRAYYEGGATNEAYDSVLAFKANAAATFDLFLPVTLSGQYVANRTGDSNTAFKQHALAELKVAEEAELGLRYGALAAYEKNVLSSESSSVATNWKNATHIRTRDEVRLGANVGYGVDWSGAKVDLDYEATFTLPTQPANQDKTLTHEVDVVYAFTKDVKLTLGGTVEQTLSSPVVNDFGYSAGLSVNF